MKKQLKWVCIPVLLGLFWFSGLISDKISLQNDLIRLHVVANSDSPEDQALKLQVRDAVVAWLEPAMECITDKEQAQAYILENLEALTNTANRVLQELGVSDRATVSLTREEFDTRHYETFSLPSGVYDALRVEIGSGEGKNWWCVVFPSLCMPSATDDVQDMAVSSGFSEDLSNTLTRKDGYKIRFLLLDWIGKLENFFR